MPTVLAHPYMQTTTRASILEVLIQRVQVRKVLLVKDKSVQHHTILGPLFNRVQTRVNELMKVSFCRPSVPSIPAKVQGYWNSTDVKFLTSILEIFSERKVDRLH